MKKYKRTDNNRRIQHIVHIRSFDHVQSHVCLKPWIISDTAVSFQQVNEHSSHNLFSFLHSFNQSVLLLRSSFCLVMSYFNTSIIFHTVNRYNTTHTPPPQLLLVSPSLFSSEDCLQSHNPLRQDSLHAQELNDPSQPGDNWLIWDLVCIMSLHSLWGSHNICSHT